MATRQLQIGAFVKTSKQPHRFGKIVAEKGKKKWQVEFPDGDEKLTSGQLQFVDTITNKSDLPPTFLSNFDLQDVAVSEKR